jgi:hypothetical protein
MRRRVVTTLVTVGLVAIPDAASAHGVSGRSDLPLPLTLVSYAAGAVLVVTFAALAWLWPRPRWEKGIAGRLLPDRIQTLLRIAAWPLRIAGVAILVVVLYAAATGPDDPQRNIAPTAVYVLFWVGVLFASGVVGDLWRAVGPIWTIGRALARRAREYTLGYWPAAVGLTAFTWLELVHPEPGAARVLAVAMSVYLIVTFVGAAIWGRAWLHEGDPFSALFDLVAGMAPLHAGDDGRLRLRPPLVGLSTIRPRPGMVALVCVALGSTTYDGLSRTRLWTGIFGEGGLIIGTLGLLWTIAAVYALYRIAVSLMPSLAGVPSEDRDPDEVASAFVHSLIPITLAYAIAHYFSLLVFEGQTALKLASDPLGRGWDLFGRAGWQISYTALSPSAIAYVQVAAIVAGHVAGVVLAHDRAVARYPVKVATRTQYPLLAVMVAYTVGALVILLSG